MKSNIRKAIGRSVSGTLAALIGLSTLATSASAASTGINIGYTWNSKVNPSISVKKSAKSGGVSGQYVKSGEQICRFVPSSGSDWAFCIEPAKSMQGTPSGTWYTQYGFTEYDTFDLSDKNKADATAYWKKLGGTDGDIAKYMGLVQYYGYASHKNGNYYAATQLLIWELILGYRGHTASTFGTCSDILWNDFTYPSGGWCSKSGVKKAYNAIVSKVKSHYSMPGVMENTAALSKENPRIMKFKTDKMRYEATFKIKSDFLKADTLEHNFSTFKSKLESMVKAKFSGKYGTDFGIDTETDGDYTAFIVWSKERQFTASVYTTDSIDMQIKSGLKRSESLFASSSYQTCLLSTKIDPVKGYTSLAAYNEPNLTVEKTYTDSGNNAITATALSNLLDKTTFVVTTSINDKKYYVVADFTESASGYIFRKYTTSASEATKFKTINNTNSKGTFTIFDLPTSMSSGRTYTVTEYSVPDNERYEKLSKSVKLPSPTSDFKTNAGTGTVKLNNNEEGYDAKIGTATLDKIVENGDGKALSSDNATDIATLAGIYKTTKFIVGYWDGTTMRYLTNGYTSAKSAFDGDLSDLNNYNDTAYKFGDGMYYVPTKLDSNHKVIFDSTRTSTDISKAYVFSPGYNYSGSDTCDYFGQVYLNLLPVNSSGVSQEVVFIEVNGAKGYGYDEDIDTSKALSLSTLGSNTNKRNISGIIKNDTGKSYTVTDTSGSKYVISVGKYYPISGNKLESNKLHSDAEIVNELVNYELVLTKKDDSNAVLSGATYGLYNGSKKLLKTATTGSDGKARFDYNLVPNIDYYVHEITAPAGYVLDTEYYKINRSNAVGNDLDNFQNAKLSDYGYEVKDKPYELNIELNKYDIINGVSIEGITFDVSLDGKTVATLTTDKKGHASISELPLGKLNGDTFSNVYKVTERENEQYIMLDEEGNASRELEIVTTIDDIESKTNPVITYSADIPNTLQLVDLKVHKQDELGNPVKGVVFDVASADSVEFNGKVVQQKGEVIGRIVTDENGVASSSFNEYESDGTQGYKKTLPIFPNHEYMVIERSAPAPYVVPKNNVTKFNATSEKAELAAIPQDVTVSDNVQNGVLDVYKQDIDTKKPLANATFEVRAAEDFSIGSKQLHKQGDLICTMTTGADGHATSGDAEMFVGAGYVLSEISAPEGYTLNSDRKEFEFNFAGNEFEYSQLAIDFDNDNQKGKISVHKTGEVFSSVNAVSSAYRDEDGNVTIDPTTYGFVFTDGDLEGAVFEITAAEDIITPDGTIRAKAGDIVATLTTDEKGCAESDLLYLGKYTVTEKQAAFGYVNNSEPQTVELTYAGQEIAIRDTVSTDFENEYQQVNIHLTKFMEHDETFGIGENGEYKNVSFGLYTAEEMTAADGSSVPADSLIDVAGLGEDMTAAFDAKIPFGKYYVREIATDEHYIINGEKYLVTYEYAGQDIETVDIDCGQFVNDIIRGSVKGMKINEIGEPLADATFGLFRADTETFDAASAILTSTSDDNGSFGFDDVPYGKYIVTEITPPSGYVMSDVRFDVVITEDGQMIEITAENTPLYLNVSKKDIYGNELKGAVMQIIDSEGNVFDEWISDGSEHIVTHIPAGNYTLKEIASPDGYVIATEIKFTIDVYNHVTTESVDAVSIDSDGKPTITMVDDTTKVHITKLDITGTTEVVGAELTLSDSEGNIIDVWTSTNEAHIIEGVLTAGGTYTLHEEYAPDGYVVANDVTFTVSDNGEIDKVVMYDDTTKVKISKRDITTDKELPGATLQILDKDGSVVEEWISTNEAHYIEAVLIAGENYKLHETIAPDGYEIANDVDFTVNADGSVTEVVMYDEKKPEEEKPNEDTPHENTPHEDIPHTDVPSSNTPDVSNPHTGVPEVSNKAAIILACASLLLMVSMFIRKDEDNENGEN